MTAYRTPFHTWAASCKDRLGGYCDPRRRAACETVPLDTCRVTACGHCPVKPLQYACEEERCLRSEEYRAAVKEIK